jgi:branched-chain amino acid transport system permease protein
MIVTAWSGLVLGAIYAITACCLNVGMLSGGVFNFAQAAVIVAGMYSVTSFMSSGLHAVPSIGLNLILAFALGSLVEIIAIRPLRRRTAGAQQSELVTTIGLSTAIVGILGLRWTYDPERVPFVGPALDTDFFGFHQAPAEIFVVILTIVTALGLHLWFRRTRWGVACLAAAEDRVAAQLRGVNVSRLSLIGFGAAGALGGFAALLIGPITFATPTFADTLVLGGFVAIALGGQGSFLGGLLGGAMAGLTSAFATRYVGADYGNVSVLILLILTLLLMPAGIGGGPARRHV